MRLGHQHLPAPPPYDTNRPPAGSPLHHNNSHPTKIEHLHLPAQPPSCTNRQPVVRLLQLLHRLYKTYLKRIEPQYFPVQPLFLSNK